MLAKVAGLISRVTGAMAGAVLIGMTAYTLIEIVLRSTSGAGTNVMTEFVGYALATMTLLGAAETAREGGLIRVSLLLHFLPDFVRRVLDAICLIAAIAVVAFAAHFVFLDMERSYLRGYETDSLIPLPSWVPPLGMFIGMIAFTFEMLAQLMLVLLGRGKIRDDVPEPA